jgi:hypothetical protein
MASGGTTTTDNALLEFLFRDGSYTPAATYYVALFTAAPGYAGGGTEVSGGSYARVAIDNDAAEWTAASGRQISNVNAIEFPQATASWGTVTHFALMSASSGGTMIAWGALTTPVDCPVGSQRQFPAGALTIRID